MVSLHAIPRRGAGGGPEAGPRGNCVAVMPCGAWDYEIRKSKGPGVAPCFLICVIGSGCSLFRALPYHYRAMARGSFYLVSFRRYPYVWASDGCLCSHTRWIRRQKKREMDPTVRAHTTVPSRRPWTDRRHSRDTSSAAHSMARS